MADATEGKQLPSLKLDVTPKSKIKLPDDLKGKWTVLYFYPEDDTPGCTKQACSYQENIARFKEMQIDVLGVSLDSLDSHAAFQKKFSLGFPLIADTNHELSEALGVYGDQEWQGEVFKGLSRDSFLIDPEGRVCKAWRKVDPKTTVEETYKTALELRESK